MTKWCVHGPSVSAGGIYSRDWGTHLADFGGCVRHGCLLGVVLTDPRAALRGGGESLGSARRTWAATGARARCADRRRVLDGKYMCLWAAAGRTEEEAREQRQASRAMGWHRNTPRRLCMTTAARPKRSFSRLPHAHPHTQKIEKGINIRDKFRRDRCLGLHRARCTGHLRAGTPLPARSRRYY